MSSSIDLPNAVLNWTAYSVSGVTVSYYFMCVEIDPASAECYSETRVDPSQTSYTVSGLTEPGLYYLTVYAETNFRVVVLCCNSCNLQLRITFTFV